MMTLEHLAIVGLVALLFGGGAFVIWMLTSDAKERRKHYKITLTVTPQGDLGQYRSKLEPLSKEPINVVPYSDALLCDLDVRLSDGKVTVYDLRQKDRLERLWK